MEKLRERLKRVHEKFIMMTTHNDGPISIDIDEAKDICEFFETFLYDSEE